MALTKEDSYNLLRELSEYGTTLYYITQKEEDKQTISLSEIESLLYKDNMEQVGLVFPKMMSKIAIADIEDSEEKYKQNYTKIDCLKHLLENHQDKYLHLQEIQDIALTYELVDQIIKDNTYHEAMNLEFTDKIIKHLEEHPKDAFLSTKEKIKNYRLALDKLKEENEQKLSTDISNYYISTITE